MDIRLALLLLCLCSKGITNAEVEEVVPTVPLLPSKPIEATASAPAPPADSTLERPTESTTQYPPPTTAVINEDNENDTLSEEDLDGPCESVGRGSRAIRAIAKAIQRTGMELLENLKPTEDEPNVIISPLSISLALSQLALGAVNETEELLMSHLHGNTLPCYHESLHNVLVQLKRDDLQIATRIFLRQGFEPKEQFTKDSQRLYESEPAVLEGLQQINTWVEQATNGKMTNFLTSLPSNLLLMLINAVHFKGEWSARFDPRFTSKGVFYINQNQLVDVDMMEGPKHPLSLYLDQGMEAHVARLRFRKRMSLIIVMPVSGQVNVSTLAKTLSISGLYNRLPKEKAVKVTIPKLKLEYTQALQDVFTNLGLGGMFSNPNLAGIAEGPLMVSSVMHKSSMELNEEGAEAAAATAVVISRSSTPVFHLNRPFFFALVDDMTKVPILMGVVNNPNPGAPNIRKMDAANDFMLTTQLNSLAEQNLLEPNCVCMLKKSVTNVLKDGRRVIIILDIEVLKQAKDVSGKLGDPTPFVEGQGGKAPQSAEPTAPVRPLQPQNGNESFNKEFGKKATPSAMPSTPGGSSKVVPIASLNPYQSKWTIRARVTNKSSIRTWSNSRGDGKLFSMEIVDETGEIRITGFNQEVDKFYSIIEVGKVFYISKGTLKIANKQYSSMKNDYEMTLNGETSIIPCAEDATDIPVALCDFIAISDLEAREKDSVLDVIGVCKSVDELTRLTTKTSREVSKRTFNLMDMSGKVVSVTLWGEEAENFDGSGQPVVAIKGAKLSDFGGRSLSASFSSTVMINPDIPEAHKLRGWYDKEGHAVDGQSLTELRGGGGGGGANTNWKTLSDVKTEHLGHGDKADYFSSIATIVYLRKENCLYQACPNQDCNKKVVDQQNGMFRCEKCDKEFPNYKYRLILSANIADYGDNQWVTCFQESAEAILGQNAAYLGQLKESNEAAFDEVFQQANFHTFIFRSRVKLETYNDESRIKATVMDVKPVDHKEYSKRLILNIRKMAA
ncbi:hypothetical protein NHX12_008676 [Muraenolepis orangiensis]|uniref:Replication protein A subunit n=1 Tax=Muraenolepis orangiensis TaxID=630683 RepID=A0A9Q0I8A1_9TELE|nr:hypothetical protein NHX12_008676 [Muraenolepis orangiensis]